MPLPTPARHCRQCGTAVDLRVPDDGDTRKRAVCPACHTIHYDNPVNVVGTLPVWGEHSEFVLLCRRNIQPRMGFWTLPAGFLELGETTAEGALRETAEEAGCPIELGPLYTLINVLPAGQVHFFYQARLLAPTWNPGHETQEVGLFTEATLPWDDLAFETVRQTLKHHFQDLKNLAPHQKQPSAHLHHKLIALDLR